MSICFSKFYYNPNPYPAPTPITADRIMILIGCTFLNASTVVTANNPRNIQKPAEEKADIPIPDGKNTVLVTDIKAAPIIPTTAGFKPDMIPPTALLFSYFSKHFAIISIMI